MIPPALAPGIAAFLPTINLLQGRKVNALDILAPGECTPTFNHTQEFS